MRCWAKPVTPYMPYAKSLAEDIIPERLRRFFI
jgi:hypothetical protein